MEVPTTTAADFRCEGPYVRTLLIFLHFTIWLVKKENGPTTREPLASQILYTRPPAYTTLTRLTARAQIVVLVALVHARRSLSR